MEVSSVVLLVLVVIAVLGGVGIATLGPGGIFVTIALFLLLPLSSAEVAGTASATFVGTGLLGWYVYVRSGELRNALDQRLAVILCASSVGGAVFGATINVAIARETYGLLLGVFVLLVGGVIIHREVRGISPRYVCDVGKRTGMVVAGVVGVGVGVVSGTLGVGGPVLAVPVLVVLGIPMLSAVAVAQVQSVWIAGFATAGYVVHDAVIWWLAGVLLVPQLLGVYVGWRVAHNTPPRRLKLALGAAMILISLYILSSIRSGGFT